jgi:hypothetical protein
LAWNASTIEAGIRPALTPRTRSGWSILTRLRVAEIVDEVVGPRWVDAGASVGTYLALAALNRLVDPCSRRSLAGMRIAKARSRLRGGASKLSVN